MPQGEDTPATRPRSPRRPGTSDAKRAAEDSAASPPPIADPFAVPAATPVHTTTAGNNADSTTKDVEKPPREPPVELDPTKLTSTRQLGQSTYADVWLGQYDGKPIAIKKLRAGDGVDSFVHEVALLTRFKCDCIVSCIGVVGYGTPAMQLVFEYMENGDLASFLRKTKHDADASFPWPQKIDCSLDMVEGLVYLHKTDLIHRGIRSLNVLLNDNMQAKLADFGATRSLAPSSLSPPATLAFTRTPSSSPSKASSATTPTTPSGTLRRYISWIAPELLRHERETVKADIYALGVVFTELTTHELPFADAKDANGNPLSDADLVRLVSDGQIVPTMESVAPVWFRHLASQCMHHDPEKRPSAAALSFAIRQQTTTPSLQSSDGKVTVRVVVRMARGLVDTQAFVTQDPYCVLMLGGSKASTKVDMDGDRAPVWNEEFVFDDVDVMNDQLELTIRHKGYLVVGAI
ncbi:hypothetical protein As57867_018643, partial [Aphanomyces stellatus]